MTVIGLNGDKVLFEYDVILPPQVNKDYWLVDVIELGAFITMCVMGGTIILALLFDWIFFHRFEYHALW